MFAFRVAGEEEEVSWVLQGQRRLYVGDDGDLRDLVDTATTLGSGAGQHHPADEVGRLQCYDLSDTATEREPEQVDLLEPQRADEGDGVAPHLIDLMWYRGAGRTDSAVVEGDHPVVSGDAVDDPWIPVVENCGQVVQEDHGNVRAGAEFAIGKWHSSDVDGAGGCVFPLHFCGPSFVVWCFGCEFGSG